MFFRKQNILKSGLLDGFTDRHTHLLPGVDDGFRTLGDTLEALAYMESAGVAEIWLTPHIMEDIPNTTGFLRERYGELSEAYKGPIKLNLASENMLDNLFEERLEADDLLPMEDNLLLIETSYFNPPIDLQKMLGDIVAKGYRPLLAHPERYKYMDDSHYARLKRQGVLFQLNLGAISGGYSKTTQQKASSLLRQGYYDFAGSDCHNLRHYQSAVTAPVHSKDLKSLLQIAR